VSRPVGGVYQLGLEVRRTVATHARAGERYRQNLLSENNHSKVLALLRVKAGRQDRNRASGNQECKLWSQRTRLWIIATVIMVTIVGSPERLAITAYEPQ